MISQFEAKYTLFDSVETMLAPETLSDILNRRVSKVNCEPLTSAHAFSGSQLFYITTDNERLVLKRSNLTVDWISIASEDRVCRSVRIWQYGVLDRLMPHIDHVILAASQNADDYALLMRDVTDGLILYNDDGHSLQTWHKLLDAQAAMHALYWEDERLNDPNLGLSTIAHVLKACWTEHCHRYPHDKKTTEYVTKGWDALYALVQPDVRDALQSLVDNPRPLLDKLAQFPSTLAHSDYRMANLALMPETHQVVAFDWQQAAYAPATICLAWFVLGADDRDEATAYYRQQLMARLGKRFNPDLWQPMLDVGNLVDVLRKGCWHALFATTSPDDETRRWQMRAIERGNDSVRAGLKWL